LRYRQRFTIVCKFNIFSSIVQLLLLGCPTAIFRGVIAVVINSVYGMFISWRQTHVYKKIVKLIPALTYRNASSTISHVRFIFSIIASCFHGKPHIIQFTFTHAMRSINFFPYLCSITSTRKSTSRLKVIATNSFRNTTRATTYPITFIFMHMRKRNYREMIEFLADKIKAFRHDILRRCSERLGVAGSRNLLFGCATLSTCILKHKMEVLYSV